MNDINADNTNRDTQSETSLIVFGAGPTVLVGFNDSGLIAGGVHVTGFSRSVNDGNTFDDMGNLPDNVNGDGGDPALARDATGGLFNARIYFATLAIDGTDEIQGFRSNDDGQNFQAPVNAMPGVAAGTTMDKEWMAVDNSPHDPSNPNNGSGNVYLAAVNSGPTRNGIYATRSVDGGNTWTNINGGNAIAAQTATASVQGAWVTVGTNHQVYIFWHESTVIAGTVTAERIRMRSSTDLGLTFGAAVTVANLTGTVNTTRLAGDLGLGVFRTNSFPQAVVNPVSGNIYVVYNDDGAGADQADVFFTQSTNGGTTWSAPVTVNETRSRNDQFQPALVVTPDGMRIGVFWYMRRRDQNNHWIDRYGAIGTVNGATVTWANNFRYSNGQFPVVAGADNSIQDATYMGDYDQAVATNQFFYTTWADNRDPSLPITGHTGRNANVRFSRIPVNGLDSPPSIIFSEPTIAAGTPATPLASPLHVTFDEPIDPTTFTVADIRSFVGPVFHDVNNNQFISDPAGNITGVTLVANTDNRQFEIAFGNAGNEEGYAIVIGPDIEDMDGTHERMDQNGNCVANDDPGDRFTGVFRVDTIGTVAPDTTPPTGLRWFHLNNTNQAIELNKVPPFSFGGTTWLPIAGDWDGDGIDTIGVFRPGGADPGTGFSTTDGTFYLKDANKNLQTLTVFQFGASNWPPVVGDWDGDGIETIGVFDQTTGTWYLRNRNAPGAADRTFVYGLANWRPVAGDWNGDGIDTVGVFQPGGIDPNQGTFHLRNSNIAGNVNASDFHDVPIFQYGLIGSTPLADDWNDDGIDTIGVWQAGGTNPGLGTFFLRNTNNVGGADLTPQYGGNTWAPITGSWDGPLPPTPGTAVVLSAYGINPAALSLDDYLAFVKELIASGAVLLAQTQDVPPSPETVGSVGEFAASSQEVPALPIPLESLLFANPEVEGTLHLAAADLVRSLLDRIASDASLPGANAGLPGRTNSASQPTGGASFEGNAVSIGNLTPELVDRALSDLSTPRDQVADRLSLDHLFSLVDELVPALF